MNVLRWLGFAAGLVLLAGVGSSVIKTLLIPRSAPSTFTSVVARSIRSGFTAATVRVADLQRRERILSAAAPTFLITLLAAWLACLLLGFGLLLWPVTPESLPAALREAGSSEFTLGFVRPSGPAPAVIVFLASASGLVLVALLIAYLPAMYAAFNRRETLVTTLEALAGTPPWGPELLARQALIGDIGYLHQVYGRWTEWAADIAESHNNYRALIYFRSPDPAASWLLSLICVLDAAALHQSLCPGSAPPEARPLLRVGYLTIRRLASGLGLPVADDPHPEDPITLTRAEFDEAVARMQAAGWTFERTPDEAWPHFHGWRVNYESAAYAMVHFLDLPPALWSGSRPRRRPPPQLPLRPPHREPRTGPARGPARNEQLPGPGPRQDAVP